MNRKFIIALLLISCITLARAQGLFETAAKTDASTSDQPFIFNGYVRGSVFGGTENFDYSSIFGEFSLQSHLKKDHLFLHSDIRFRSGTFFNEQLTSLEIKETYAGLKTEIIDVFLGEQIISWGRTDGFNPTNNITPNNYFFLSANPDDQKLPNFMLRTNFRLTPVINWEIIGIPIFRPSNYRYNLLKMGENVSFAEASAPEINFKNGSLATRLNFEYSRLGFSLSWFNGYDPFYGFDIKNIDFSTGVPVITNVANYYRKNTIGFDFSLPVGTWILRGETAANLPEDNANKIYIPNSDLAYVVALEHDFKGFQTIFQYIGKYTLDFKDLVQPVLTDPTNPMSQMEYAQGTIRYESALFNRKIFHQQEAYNHALSLIIVKSFNYETFNLELAGYYDLTSEEYMIRPTLNWNLSGSLKATLGYALMDGPDQSIFNYSSPVMSGGFIELKASF